MKETSVIVDSFILAHDAQTIESSFKHHPIPLVTKAFHRECSKTEIQRLQQKRAQQSANVVIRSGREKAVAYFSK